MFIFASACCVFLCCTIAFKGKIFPKSLLCFSTHQHFSLWSACYSEQWKKHLWVPHFETVLANQAVFIWHHSVRLKMERMEKNLQLTCFLQKVSKMNFFHSSDYRGLPRGLSDKRHCVKMWRQFVTKVSTADRSWHERGDDLRKRQSIFHFNKATTALFFFNGDMTVMTWQILTRPVWLFWSSIVCVYGRSVVQILTKTNHRSTLFTKS